MTDDAMDAFAVRLAGNACSVLDNPADAAAVLFQAGAAVLIANFPAAVALDLLAAIAADGDREMRALLGVDEVRQ